jgi:NTE family protein
VDYVAGSSMGSIIAGFYALGYHPDTMTKVIREQNWDDLLADKLQRKFLAYEEKEFSNNYIMSFPISKKRFGLKAAMYEGQEINLLVNRFYSPSYKISDFSKLQTPFLCIGTDLLTGEAVVLENGYLPMAIRASMSIPGFFSPTIYQGRYLVDGGVVNNYPVNEVKKKGIDIIIGGDVQSGLRKSIEELNSMTAVIDQITSFHRVQANKEGYAMTDIYVPFKSKYGMMDFSDYDSIIMIGEEIARKHFDEIKKLADSLNAIEYKPLKDYSTVPLDSVYIDELVVRGNDRLPESYFQNLFSDYTHKMIALDDLENSIRKAYGTKFFTHLYYELDYKDGKTNLILDVLEADIGYVSAGAHYDDDYNVSLLIDGAFRNVLGKRSKIYADIVLGPSWRIRGLYIIDNGPKPGFGAKIELYSFGFDDFDKDKAVDRLTYTNYKASVFLRSILRNDISFRVGGNFEYFRLKSKINNPGLVDYSDFNAYGNFYFAFNTDTRDKSYFSTRGSIAELRVEYVMPITKDWVSELLNNSLVFWFNYDESFPLSKKFVFRPGIFLGGTYVKGLPYSSDIPFNIHNFPSAPIQHWFYMGGLTPINYVHGFMNFTGVKFSQKIGMYQAIIRAKLQYNFLPKLYATLRADFGANEWFLADMFEPDNFIFGYGATFSYNSFIGPVELSVMGSNIHGISAFVNIGFWF